MGKFIEAAKALLEEMTSNNYHWSSERATSKASSHYQKVAFTNRTYVLVQVSFLLVNLNSNRYLSINCWQRT